MANVNKSGGETEAVSNNNNSSDQTEKTNENNAPGKIQSKRDKRKAKRNAKPTEEEEVIEKTPEELEQEAQERFDLAQTMTGRDPPPFVHMRNSEPARNKLGNDIRAADYTLQVPGKTLLIDASFTLAFGHRYGFVGRNGLGKSALLKQIAARDGINIATHLRVLYVDQEVPGDDTKPIEYVLRADDERDWLLKEQEVLLKLSEDDPFWMDNPDEKRSYSLKDVQERLFDIQSEGAIPRAAAILVGLGFDKEQIKTKPTKEYSGGWRMRISIARALFAHPDVLLLDEPTNHLDLHACFWLEQYLAKWKSTLLVVSHEATFLNEVVDHIIEIRGKKLNTYRGNYWSYMKAREIEDKTKEKTIKKIETGQGHVAGLGIQRNRPGKKPGKKGPRHQPEEEIKALQVIKDDPSLKVSFPEPDEVVPPILQFQDVSFGFENTKKDIFKNLEFGIDMDSRIALVGLNGVGKSTLMKLMVGELKETAGYVYRNRKARFAKFSQHSLEQLNASETPMEYMRNKFKAPEPEILRCLGRFGIHGPLVSHKIETLSGGQKSRVVLAELAYVAPHVLFLDEPSNHLDLDAIEALAQGLNAFEGGIVVISHNQRLISLVCDEIWVVTKAGNVNIFNGDFDDYKDEILAKMGFSGINEAKVAEGEKREKEKGGGANKGKGAAKSKDEKGGGKPKDEKGGGKIKDEKGGGKIKDEKGGGKPKDEKGGGKATGEKAKDEKGGKAKDEKGGGKAGGKEEKGGKGGGKGAKDVEEEKPAKKGPKKK